MQLFNFAPEPIQASILSNLDGTNLLKTIKSDAKYHNIIRKYRKLFTGYYYFDENSGLTNDDMKLLVGIVNIRIHYDLNVTDDGIQNIAVYPMNHVDLQDIENITDRSVFYLSQVGVKSLNIEGTAITDHSLALLGEMKNTLRYLNVSNTGNITDAGIIALSNNKVDILDIGSANVTDQSMSYIERMNVSDLTLLQCVDLTRNGIILLGKVEKLNLTNLSLDDDDMAEILPNLTCSRLILEGCEITDESLFYIRRSKTIKYVDLSSTEVSGNYMELIKGIQYKR